MSKRERGGRCGQRGKVSTEDGNRSFRVFEANKMMSAFTFSEMGNNWEILDREEETQMIHTLTESFWLLLNNKKTRAEAERSIQSLVQ